MTISVFNLFSIGLGPSSSHTVGPMRAARRFLIDCEKKGLFDSIVSLDIELFGSLALTGQGHAIDLALLMGLEGETPEGIDIASAPHRLKKIRKDKKLNLLGKKTIDFDEHSHLFYHKDQELPFHPNAIRFTGYDVDGQEVVSSIFYSTGGGFIVEHEETKHTVEKSAPSKLVPYPFKTASELLGHCNTNHLSIADVMWANESALKPKEEVRQGLLKIWKVMQESVTRGCEQEGILPGGLNLPRRAKAIQQQLLANPGSHPLEAMEWVSLWALATNEENAAGSRIVTAPTNGAAGVIPAVLHYYKQFAKNPTEEGVLTFLMTAGAIGILYKEGASISAAEMGCMGEVGVACSMAAAGLTAAIGGSLDQIEHAAEIGMEHNLGLTCDPVRCLVQIPCIERNSMGAIQAINASLLAMRSQGNHIVALDEVIEAMNMTGRDMSAKYRETSLGGLALTVKGCRQGDIQ